MDKLITYKICVYVTAYKDINSLQKCLNLLRRQSYPIEEMFVVDNSPEQIIFSGNGLQVKHFPQNVGVAGGLKAGILWAKDRGYDFLWAFDQDSEPNEFLLEKLLAKYTLLSNKQFPIGIIAPLPIDINSQSEIHGLVFQEYKLEPVSDDKTSTDFYECDVLITSGSLISMELANHVDLPREELFLDAVDYFYCMNFRSGGYKVVIAKDIVLNHNLGTTCKLKLEKSGEEITTYTCSPLRYYYSCRNHTFFETRLTKKLMLYKSIIHRLVVLKSHLLHIKCYEPDLKILKAWACIRGTIDGLIGKVGKTW
jgi:rhamnosyltransferase